MGLQRSVYIVALRMNLQENVRVACPSASTDHFIRRPNGAHVQPPGDLVESFASLDRARLTRMSEAARAEQLEARQLLMEYVDALWEDVQRAGERPDVGEKYQALAVIRELSRSMTTIAFEAVYEGQTP
jgi:hypothetical protein